MTENNNFEVKGLRTKGFDILVKIHKKRCDPRKKMRFTFLVSTKNLLIIYCHGKLRN